MKKAETTLSLELARFSGLDLIVKYAVLLTWVVYAAGLTHLSGFLRSVGVPTESSSYALPNVLSYGGFPLIELLKAAGCGFFVLKLFRHSRPHLLWKCLGWLLPAVVFIQQNSGFLHGGPFWTRLDYFAYSVAASYLVLYAIIHSKAAEIDVGYQVFGAALFFLLFAQGAGYQGDLEGYATVSQPATIRLVLAPDAIQGATGLGIQFSSATPGLTERLNMVAMSETSFYVRVPRGLTSSASPKGVELDWQPITVAIPRDKALLVGAQP